ncbi:S8 family serine peptidase [Nonomuraea sp. NPDC046570]|uniref:S8 family peptidase n=1 Tax=Nonomuraea sp. NPDC046570 TaxID=3155255 RepID=UPI0033FA7A1B
MLSALRTLAATAASASLLLYGPTAPPIRDRQQWVLNAINAEQAWTVSKGKGVIVAVIDSAVDTRTPELRNKVTVAPDMSTALFDRDGVTPGAHGTAMASLIAGSGADQGLIGVAPEARVLSVPVAVEQEPGRNMVAPEEDLLTSRDSPLARAIRYAANHGAKVISMSIGTYGPHLSEREAVAYALERGVVLVAAVGNDGQTKYAKEKDTSYWSFPAGYSGVIGVSAVDRRGKRAPFSSDNLSVQVAAPGVDVPVARMGGGYALAEGTSGAAALVAGVAALIKARHPALAPDEVALALSASARGRPAAGYDDQIGFGVVDAAAALNKAETLEGVGRQVDVPEGRHFGAGEDSPQPSRPGPEPWKLWVYTAGALAGLAAFGGSVAVLSRRDRRS